MWFTDIHGNLVNLERVRKILVSGNGNDAELRVRFDGGEDEVFFRGQYEDCQKARDFLSIRISLNSGTPVTPRID